MPTSLGAKAGPADKLLAKLLSQSFCEGSFWAFAWCFLDNLGTPSTLPDRTGCSMEVAPIHALSNAPCYIALDRPAG
jgi:hypothetical protein